MAFDKPTRLAYSAAETTSMLKAFEIAAPLFSLIGVVLGAYGTHLSLTGYTPFGITGYFRGVLNMVWLFATGRGQTAIQQLEPIAQLAESNREQQLEAAIVSIQILMVSLLFQSIGAMFWLMAAIWVSLF